MRELSGVAKVFVGALQAVLGGVRRLGVERWLRRRVRVESHGEYIDNCRVVKYVFLDIRKRK
jgi:hypothetical protein